MHLRVRGAPWPRPWDRCHATAPETWAATNWPRTSSAKQFLVMYTRSRSGAGILSSVQGWSTCNSACDAGGRLSVRMTLESQGATRRDTIRTIMRFSSPRLDSRTSNVILMDISPASDAPK